MSLGGVAFGIIFGVCLLFILFCLNRKLNTEENVLQVAATVTIAYTTYYVADSHGTSGLIATVFCGVTAKTFGTTMINDSEMMVSHLCPMATKSYIRLLISNTAHILIVWQCLYLTFNILGKLLDIIGASS